MPISLLIPTISRHGARLSTTTHRALCASIFQLQPDQPVEIYFSLATFQYGPMQHPAVQPISTLILSTIPSGSPGSLSFSLSQNHPAHKSKLQLFHAMQLRQNHMQRSSQHLFSPSPLLSGTLSPTSTKILISHYSLTSQPRKAR